MSHCTTTSKTCVCGAEILEKRSRGNVFGDKSPLNCPTLWITFETPGRSLWLDKESQSPILADCLDEENDGWT